jgi:hypothetical protein
MRDMSMEKTLALKLENGQTLRQELENVLVNRIKDQSWFSEEISFTMRQNGFIGEDAEKQVTAAIRYMCK